MRGVTWVCVVVLAACSKEEEVGVSISAAEGGTVEFQGAKLVIPAGALAEDTVITVDVLDAAGQPSEGDIVATVYDFGPDGLEFLTPVALTLEATLPGDLEGRTPVVAWSDGTAWVEVPTTVEGSSITGQIEHFTAFTVVLTAAGQTEGVCDVDDVPACGGALQGTWTYTAACATLKEAPPMPCDGASMSLTLDLDGTVTFGGDGTYSAMQTVTTTTTIRIPKSCFPMPGFSCSDFDEDAVEDGDDCVMVETESEEDDDAGTYAVSGDQVSFDDGEPSGPHDYCVDGDTLTIVYRGEDADVIYTATRAQ